MKKVLFIAFMVFNLSQAQKIQWEKSMGGIHADYLTDAQPTLDYGFILGGSSLSGKNGNKETENQGDIDYFIWKMNEHGEPEWQKSFGGSGMDWLQSVRHTTDGGFILGGTSASDISGDKKEASRGQDDIWIIKLDAQGNEMWQKTLGGIGQEKLSSVLATRDGGYLVAGSSSSDASGDKTTNRFGNMDYWIVKLDAAGKITWQQSYGGQYRDELYSAEQTQDGGYILGGYSNSPSPTNLPNSSKGGALQQGGAAQNAVHYTNAKAEDCKGEGDYWVIKTDAKGAIEWQRTLGGTGDDRLYAVHQTQDKGYLIGGNSNKQASPGLNNERVSTNTDIWLLKLDEKGITQWQETYDIAQEDVLTSIVDNQDGTFLLGCFTKGVPTMKKNDRTTMRTPTDATVYKKGTADYVALKINEKGETIWDKSVSSPGEDILKKSVMTRDGGYLLCGTRRLSPTNLPKEEAMQQGGATVYGGQDFWVVKLKDEQKPDTPKAMIEAFPNPTAGFTNVVIGFDFEKGMATLVDMAGRQLQQFEISSRTVPVDLTRYPEGIYIINIKTNDHNEGIKIIKSIK